MNIKVVFRPGYTPARCDRQGMADIVPEVIGPPSLQGAVVVQANNCPTDILDSEGNPIGAGTLDGNRKNKDAWFIPAHTPVFGSFNDGNPVDRDGVVNVTAFVGKHDNNSQVPKELMGNAQKILGISIDGVYDVEQQKAHMRSAGANRFSMAVAGLVTVASHPTDNNSFVYGDRVYVDWELSRRSPIERLHDTSFRGLSRYTTDSGKGPSIGTFVGPVGPEGGMRVLLNFFL